MKRNILICTDSMGIGGVETAIYNQISAMIKKGYNVILASTGGIYIDKVKSIGAKVVDFEFSLENNFNLKKINEMINIIEKYEINEIHVEKFMCILTMFPVCIIKKIPYIAYIHDGLNSSYEWYMYNYDIYNMLFKEFFRYANRIIAIKQSVIDFTSQMFSVDSSKYKLINNSINFDEFKTTKEVKSIRKFLIIGRLDFEKEESIKNAIDFFLQYCKLTKKYASLDILGDGKSFNKIKDYVEKVNTEGYNIQFLGKSSNVGKIIDDHDIVLGIGRCIIEAIAMKKISLVSGYDKISNIVTEENFLDMMNTNFTGKDLKCEDIENLVMKINSMTEFEIDYIVNQNYDLAFRNINIDNNIYTMNENEQSLIKIENILEEMIILQNRYLDKKNESKEFEKNVYELREICDKQYNKINQLYEKLKEQEQEINEKCKENEKIKEEKLTLENEKNKIQIQLNCIFNSKKWKLLNKIFKIYKK